jgi:hypothetical protein
MSYMFVSTVEDLVEALEVKAKGHESYMVKMNECNGDLSKLAYFMSWHGAGMHYAIVEAGVAKDLIDLYQTTLVEGYEGPTFLASVRHIVGEHLRTAALGNPYSRSTSTASNAHDDYTRHVFLQLNEALKSIKA